METLLEQQRRLHEERERLENSMAEEMLHKKQSVSSTLTFFHTNIARSWLVNLFLSCFSVLFGSCNTCSQCDGGGVAYRKTVKLEISEIESLILSNAKYKITVFYKQITIYFSFQVVFYLTFSGSGAD